MTDEQRIKALELIVADLAARIAALEGEQDDVPDEILNREATRRELPAYLRSVPGVVEVQR